MPGLLSKIARDTSNFWAGSGDGIHRLIAYCPGTKAGAINVSEKVTDFWRLTASQCTLGSGRRTKFLPSGPSIEKYAGREASIGIVLGPDFANVRDTRRWLSSVVLNQKLAWLSAIPEGLLEAVGGG